jgi:hypothetical protein
MKRVRKPVRRPAPGVIPLKDLTPKGDPQGGSGGGTKMVFGERPIVISGDEAEEVGERGSRKAPKAIREAGEVAERRRPR